MYSSGGTRASVCYSLEQWAAHWNSFHVAPAPAFNCMVRGCNFETGTAPDALDSLFHHFQDAHSDVYDGGRWTNMTDLVIRGLKIRANAQYWPPTNTMGELQRPVAVTKPTPLQLGSPIVAPGGQRAKLSIRLWWHAAGLTRRLSPERARVESVALQLPRVERELNQSPTLKLSLSQQTSGTGSAALLMQLLLLLLARQRRLVPRRAKAARAQPV